MTNERKIDITELEERKIDITALVERIAKLEEDVAFLRRQIEFRRIVQEDYILTKDEMLKGQDFD